LGRRYTARTISGAYAEYALALAEQVYPPPANIDFKQDAGIWVPYGTAYGLSMLAKQVRPQAAEILGGFYHADVFASHVPILQQCE
jgi:NADPH:quinone reductase-like Zn-dependent oxidoreductase